MLLVLIIILLLCSGGGFYTGNHGIGSILGVILFVVLIAMLFGWRI